MSTIGQSHRYYNVLRTKSQSEISKIVSNQLTYRDLPPPRTLAPDSLATAFLLLPLGTTNQDHIKFIYDIGPVLAEAIWNNDREERLDYTLSRRFLDKLAFFILSSRKENIETYLKPFIEILGEDRETENFFSSLYGPRQSEPI